MRAEPFRYVPMLKAKQGEFQALRNLTSWTKDSVRPLLEAAPLDGYGDNEPAPTKPEVHTSLSRISKQIETSWGVDLPFFLDLGYVEGDPRLSAGLHPLERVFDDLRERGARGTPVTSLTRDASYQEAVGVTAGEDSRGVCVRLTPSDLEDPEEAIAATLELARALEVAVEDVDLILDLGTLPQSIGTSVLAVDVTLRNLERRDDWRSITVASTGFPSVADFDADSINFARRSDWDLWQRIQNRDLPRSPSFGDYGVFGTQGVASGPPPRFAPSPNLRYTTDDDWLVLKARGPKHGNDQFNDLCADLVKRDEYSGSDFSWADGYIQRCADNIDGPGNATKWIEVGTNHHITFVDDQLATLAGT